MKQLVLLSLIWLPLISGCCVMKQPKVKISAKPGAIKTYTQDGIYDALTQGTVTVALTGKF